MHQHDVSSGVIPDGTSLSILARLRKSEEEMHMARVTDRPTKATESRQGIVAGRSRGSRGYYLALTFLLIAMVIRGFWPSYFGLLVRGGVRRPWLIHLHGAIFSGWMVLLLAQVALVAAGRVRLHRRVGQVGIAYGTLVLGIGLVVSVVAPVWHVHAGEWTVDRAAGFLLAPLGDMALFGGFFLTAIAYRRRPEIHKRLILAATVALAFAAVGRMAFVSPVVFLLVWLSPLFTAMAFDVFTRRRVHPVYVISVAVLAAAFVRIFFMQSPGWLKIGRALLLPFL